MSWQFGALSVERIVESAGPLLSPFEIFPDATEQHLAAERHWLGPRFRDPASGLLTITIQSFLIRRPGLTILVDTCAGNHKRRARADFDGREWPWLDRLAAAGVRPEDVDIVMCSHLHVDHVGWNTRLVDGRWVPTFPNARYLFSRREWDYWRAESARDGLPRTGDYVADSVLPVVAAGQAEMIDEDFAVGPDLWLEAAAGHTPGHFVTHLAGRAILSGDLFHHPLQLRHPQWSTRFCADQAASRATRLRLLNAWADKDTLILPAHFPAPSCGHVLRHGDHFAFRFDGEEAAFPHG